MTDALHELTARLQQVEEDIETELKHRRATLRADFEDRKVHFEQDVLAAQRRFRTGLLAYLRDASWLSLLTAPVIYVGIVPLLLLDGFLTLYQWICFPVYGIARVHRRDHFHYDRRQLVYLNPVEKLNCAYCSYGSGVERYFREVIGRTEQYWCPIKHARRVRDAHRYYHRFPDFGDAEAYRRELPGLRRELRHAGRRAH